MQQIKCTCEPPDSQGPGQAGRVSAVRLGLRPLALPTRDGEGSSADPRPGRHPAPICACGTGCLGRAGTGVGLPCLGCRALGASEDTPCRSQDAAQSGHLGCVSTLPLSVGSPELLSVSQPSRLGTRAPEDDLDPPWDAAAPEGLQLVRDGGLSSVP